MILIGKLFVRDDYGWLQQRLMEQCGHGEEIIGEIYDKIVQVLGVFHHQFKYLVLHGVGCILLATMLVQPKLMEHYGHGEANMEDD